MLCVCAHASAPMRVALTGAFQHGLKTPTTMRRCLHNRVRPVLVRGCSGVERYRLHLAWREGLLSLSLSFSLSLSVSLSLSRVHLKDSFVFLRRSSTCRAVCFCFSSGVVPLDGFALVVPLPEILKFPSSGIFLVWNGSRVNPFRRCRPSSQIFDSNDFGALSSRQ